MRRPTKKEASVLARCIMNLTEDLNALLNGADPGITLYDVLGTMRVNISVLHSIHQQLTLEEEKSAQTD